ncbi:MAG: murein L,D-transpeptidase family protein [Pseudomonadota bacterium]
MNVSRQPWLIAVAIAVGTCASAARAQQNAPAAHSLLQTIQNPVTAAAPTSSIPKRVGWIEGELRKQMQAGGFTWGAPVHVRIFKAENTLEIWMARNDRFARFKSLKICKWSGKLGPKFREGDEQSPEGVYAITRKHLLSRTKNHRAISLDFPNAYDRRHSRTGTYLQIHGGCGSVGCYAMTDRGIEEIYRLLDAALDGGQPRIMAHIFPFRMTEKNLTRRKTHPSHSEWAMLQPIYAAFERTRTVPAVRVCGRRYVLNSHGARPPERCVPVWHKPSKGHSTKQVATASAEPSAARKARKRPRIVVRCNLNLPSCRRWLAIQRRKLARRGVSAPGIRQAGPGYVRRGGARRAISGKRRVSRNLAREQRRRRLRR